MPQSLYTRVANMVKQAYYSLVNADSSSYPVGQATVNGKPTSFVRLSTYGVCSNPPAESHILLINSQGQESAKFGILNDFIRRKKNLKEGEVALFNTKTQAEVYLREDGSILIKSSENIDVDGNLNVNGNLSVTGTITAAENISVPANKDILVGTISVKNHNHGGVEPGSGSTLPPTT